MSEYDEFLEALQKHADDTSLRLAFADWLDERGEHEEANRHRQWPAAKEWFVRLCHEHNPPPEADPELHRISPEQLIERGHQTVRGLLQMFLPRGLSSIPAEALRQMLTGGWEALMGNEPDELDERLESWRFDVDFNNNMDLRDAVDENIHAFWKNWSIITGVPLPPGIEEKSRFTCGC